MPKFHKIISIAGSDFKYKSPTDLMRKIWREASNMSLLIRNLNRRREFLLKKYRDLDWKQQRKEYERYESQSN